MGHLKRTFPQVKKIPEKKRGKPHKPKDPKKEKR